MSEPANRFQEQFGVSTERTSGKVRDHMLPWIQEYIRKAPLAVMATANHDGHCDASPRGGQPGFVRVIDERTLLMPDVAGNRLFHSYTNIEENPEVGLIFFIPGVHDTARVNGHVELVSKEDLEKLNIELAVFDPDEKAKNLQGLMIHVREAYGHCPRSLKHARFWNVETIQNNDEHPPILKRPSGV